MKKLWFLLVFSVSFATYAVTPTVDPQARTTDTSTMNQQESDASQDNSNTNAPQDSDNSSPSSPSMATPAGTVEPGP